MAATGSARLGADGGSGRTCEEAKCLVNSQCSLGKYSV